MPDTLYYLGDMRQTTLEYTTKWKLGAGKMALAYSQAFAHQQKVLNGIKKSIEAAQKREEAMMSFALGLLTGGIVGPLADRFVDKAVKGTLKDVVGNTLKDSLLTEWTAETVKELAKSGDEKLRELGLDQIKPKVQENGFSPAAQSPLDYVLKLQLGIDERADAMSDIARDFYRDFHFITPDLAERARDKFLSTSFFTGLPKKEAEIPALQRSAELMLWIAWARLRDKSYWANQHALLRAPSQTAYSESWHWGPLLPELFRLRVPILQMTWAAYSVRGRVTTIDMPAFIRWAESGGSAVDTVFQDLPTDKEGLQKVRSELWFRLN